MSKIFVNENLQAPADPGPVVVQQTVIHPAVFRATVIQPAVVQPTVVQPVGDAAQNVAKALFVLAIFCGAGLLLYHYWKSVLLVLVAIGAFAWWSTRGVSIGSMFVLLVVLAILGKSAGAQTVTDGDTLKLNGTTYRLWGIDAPESKQLCSGRPMGGVATEALKNLMRGKAVTCEERAKDRYGRTVALCRANGKDLSAAMVEDGWAFAFVRYSRDYVALEEKARSENIGVHPFSCDKPWEWRTRAH